MYIRGDRGKQTAWVYMHCQGNGTEVGFQRYTEAMQQHQAAWKQQRAPFFFFSSTEQSPLLTTQDASWRRGTVSCGTPLVRGIWGHKQAKRWSTQSGPYAMQTGVPSGSVNRRLAPQGRWGDKQDSEEEEGGSKCTAGWTTSVTPCFRFPWRQDQTLSTLPPQSLFLPLEQHSLTTRSQHGSRQTRVVGAGFSSFAAAPRSCF